MRSDPAAKDPILHSASLALVLGVPVESTSVMTVDSASAYRINIQSKGGGKATKETLVAKRIGDC